MCKVSIIIPVYNVDKYIEKCLTSVLNQTMTDYEVIVIDDGSTDETGVICDQFAAKDTRIRVIHKKNEGVSAARNLGISMAVGDYFAFWDGDDYVKPECLEEVCRLAEEEQCDSVIFGYYLVEDGKITETHPPIFEKKCYTGSEILEQVVPKFVGVSYDDINERIQGKKDAFQKDNTALWHQFLRADFIRENHLLFDTTLKVGEDTCFTTEYLSLAKKCCVLSKCYYHLVVRETSTIYTYERDPLAVVEGKRNLLYSRRALTERIKERCGYEIEKLWSGSVVMSIPQLALKLAPRQPDISLRDKYRSWHSYIMEAETQRALRDFHPHGNPVKVLGFRIIKTGPYPLLFFGCVVITLLGVHVER